MAYGVEGGGEEKEGERGRVRRRKDEESDREGKREEKKKGEVGKMIDKLRCEVEEISRQVLFPCIHQTSMTPGAGPILAGYLLVYGDLAVGGSTAEAETGVWASHALCTVLSQKIAGSPPDNFSVLCSLRV